MAKLMFICDMSSLNKKRGETSYWTCIDKNCPGSGKLTLQEDSIGVNSSTHNHLATPIENSIHMAKQQIIILNTAVFFVIYTTGIAS